MLNSNVIVEDPLGDLRKDLYARPGPSVLMAARWILEIWPRIYVPDWVELLATADLKGWEGTCALAREEIEGEAADLATMPGLEAEPVALPTEPTNGDGRRSVLRALMMAKKGQGLVEVALGLGLLAILALMFMGFLETAQGQQMRSWAAGAAAQLEAAASQHAVERHGADASVVAAALSCSGPIDRIQNPVTGRWANTCQVGDKFGIYIEDPDGTCRTCFIKEKLNSYEQVLRYLANRGYIKP